MGLMMRMRMICSSDGPKDSSFVFKKVTEGTPSPRKQGGFGVP